MYWTAMSERRGSVWQRLRQLGTLMAVGMGLSLSNSRAVLEAVSGIDSEFKRTPKFAVTSEPAQWHSSTYVLARNPMVWMELVFAVYSLVLLAFCLFQGMWWVSMWVLLYAVGYSYIVYLAFFQAWQLSRSAWRAPAKNESSMEVIDQFQRHELAREP